jgi:hypothetical protein
MALTLAVDQIQPVSNTAKYIDWQGVPTGMPIAINVVSYAIRTSVSVNDASKAGILFGGYFTKLRNDTVLRASCTVFGAGYYSGNCGVGMVLDFNTSNEQWDYGCAYQYDGSWSSTLQTTIVMGHSQWTGIRAGQHLISFGWKPADNSSGQKPFNILSPNNNDDSRNQQMPCRIVIYEVAP